EGDLLSRDGLHQNDLGYRCMAEHIARAVVVSAFSFQRSVALRRQRSSSHIASSTVRTKLALHYRAGLSPALHQNLAPLELGAWKHLPDGSGEVPSRSSGVRNVAAEIGQVDTSKNPAPLQPGSNQIKDLAAPGNASG